ncbi:unnamed protein product [Dicrocoelium dendriticum]|nr:unnamed protein product [Dicrocoelium dendriticum]
MNCVLQTVALLVVVTGTHSCKKSVDYGPKDTVCMCHSTEANEGHDYVELPTYENTCDGVNVARRPRCRVDCILVVQG